MAKLGILVIVCLGISLAVLVTEVTAGKGCAEKEKKIYRDVASVLIIYQAEANDAVMNTLLQAGKIIGELQSKLAAIIKAVEERGGLGETTPGLSASTQAPEQSGSSESPEGSVTPDNPEGSVTPENPEGSVTPENPEGSVTPGEPEGSVTPGNPEGSVTPGNPEGSVTPDNPEGSILSKKPGHSATTKHHGHLGGSKKPKHHHTTPRLPV